MRWLCLTTAIILMSLSPCAAQDTPEIQSDGVFFPSTGKFISVEPASIIPLDPEEFPLGNIHVRRTVELLTQWRRVLVLEAQTYYEGARLFPIFYDYNGVLIHHHSEGFYGPLFFFASERRYFDCGQSSYYKTTHAHLVDESGEEIAKLPHPNDLYRCSQTEDQVLVVQEFALLRKDEDTWYTLVRVIDFTGVVSEFEVHEETVHSFTYDGRTYRFQIPKPGVMPYILE